MPFGYVAIHIAVDILGLDLQEMSIRAQSGSEMDFQRLKDLYLFLYFILFVYFIVV